VFYCNIGEWASTVSVFEELLRTEQEAKERAVTVDFATSAPQPSQTASTATTATRDQKANRKAVKYCFEAALVAMEYTRQPQRALEVRSNIVFGNLAVACYADATCVHDTFVCSTMLVYRHCRTSACAAMVCMSSTHTFTCASGRVVNSVLQYRTVYHVSCKHARRLNVHF
jgi:hypothetical protein